MKDNRTFLNTALAVILGVGLAVCVVLRTIIPMGVLPRLDIPNMVLLSLGALLADHYFGKAASRCYLCMALLAALTFGLLPWAAGFATGMEALRLGLVGGVVFPLTTTLFTSAQDRLSTGPAAKAAPVLTAFGLYLASQCFMGIIL